MVMGPVFCGKTTLCQYLAGLPRIYAKTQTVGIIGSSIDTPGEYLENRGLRNRLAVTAADAGLILFLQDCTSRNVYFSPGQAAMFAVPVAGVITKTDLAAAEEISRAEEILNFSGASPLFAVSSLLGRGMEALVHFINSQSA
ncbi:MAG: EutP/PduV family microcompartment system protein [Treponema sp.]|jgi:ethanolamine utilization protein EutP|nr:EutP/PduV family microcompartment system protein [Treponema sp.]